MALFQPWPELLPEMQRIVAQFLDLGTRQCLSMTCREHKKTWYDKNISRLSTRPSRETGSFFQTAHLRFIKSYFYKHYTCYPSLDFTRDKYIDLRLKRELSLLCKTRPINELLDIVDYCFALERLEQARCSKIRKWWIGYTREMMPETLTAPETIVRAIG